MLTLTQGTIQRTIGRKAFFLNDLLLCIGVCVPLWGCVLHVHTGFFTEHGVWDHPEQRSSCASLMGVLRTEPSSSAWTVSACNRWSVFSCLLFLKVPMTGCRITRFLKTENTLVKGYMHFRSLNSTPLTHFPVGGACAWWQWSNGGDSQAGKTEKGCARTKKD